MMTPSLTGASRATPFSPHSQRMSNAAWLKCMACPGSFNRGHLLWTGPRPMPSRRSATGHDPSLPFRPSHS
jgi:hypothetical protein